MKYMSIFVLFLFFSRVISFSLLPALEVSQVSYCDIDSILNWNCKTCDSDMILGSIVEHHG